MWEYFYTVCYLSSAKSKLPDVNPVKLLIIIRKFQPHDFPWVIDIEKKVFDEHDPYFYMQFYETCSEGFIVAEINGFVVGYIVGFRMSEETGRIFSFAIHPAYQNLGAGSALIREIINVFSKTSVSEIILEVRQSNTRAKKFYERHGFYSIGVAEKYYNDNENAVLMRFQLER
ncbi:MAG: ribosomal-protein-alanine N-acetyltransferase [Candidatus Methanoperedens sp.]|nr:ribosomal-protein-alanine N-acetyltransferase [Candidatus Methanoperedens sp.]